MSRVRHFRRTHQWLTASEGVSPSERTKEPSTEEMRRRSRRIFEGGGDVVRESFALS